MAESRRRYTWRAGWDDDLAAVAALEHVAAAIQRWGGRRQWLSDCAVEAVGNGQLLVRATVRGRDQWRVHERQVRLIAAVAAALRERRGIFGEPGIERLAPHRNRGREARAAE